MTAKARKVKKADRIANPVSSADAAAWRAAIEPLDNAVLKMESKWGSLGRLLRLVNPETAAKFASAQWKLDDAIDRAAVAEAGYQECAQRASVVMRGLMVMDAEAEAAGAEPMPAILSYEIDGRHLIVCQHETDTTKVAKEFPKAEIWSLPELLRVTEYWSELMTVKRTFPGATVTSVKKEKGPSSLDDPLGF